jgi:ABC-type dipeptide/oligopeptide/nickel transport system ATPase component
LETIALVGASGTGKSHRAVLVAEENDIDLIIDDGLLIKGSRILAGFSSKSQPTKVGAIKTALFTKEKHAQEVINTINTEKPKRILILGTSEGMVLKVAKKLKLPLPKKIITINDIATDDEIIRASEIRKKYNKHVIPAPTLEVKPKLSGILTSPLQTIFSKRKQDSYLAHLKVEQTVVKPTFSFLGKFYIANSVLYKITAYSLSDINEVDKILKSGIETNNDGIVIDISLSLFYSKELNLPEIGRKIQKNITDNIEHMTALHIKKIDITMKKLNFMY